MPHIKIDRKPIIADFEGGFASLGLCFAQNLQREIEPFGFPYWFNPASCAHYSTESMANLIEIVANGGNHTDDDLFFVDEQRQEVSAYRYHEMFCRGPNAVKKAHAQMLEAARETYLNLAACANLVVTLGTSRICRLRANGAILNSVSYIAPEFWTSELLSVEDNIRHLERLFAAITTIRNGNLPNIFLTISPQRYLFAFEHEPFVDNMLSKSILRVAVAKFIESHPELHIEYFPAYEIVLEELRQLETISHYDFCHIEQAHTPRYVVKRFLQTYCTDAVLGQFSLVEQMKRDIEDVAKMISGGMHPADPRIVERVQKSFKSVDALGHSPSPAIIVEMKRFVGLLPEWFFSTDERSRQAEYIWLKFGAPVYAAQKTEMLERRARALAELKNFF